MVIRIDIKLLVSAFGESMLNFNFGYLIDTRSSYSDNLPGKHRLNSVGVGKIMICLRDTLSYFSIHSGLHIVFFMVC